MINAIRKEDHDKEFLLSVDYPRHLWMEKEVKTVANVASDDVRKFLDLAAEIPIVPEGETDSPDQANQALMDLRHKRIRGAKVLVF